MKPIGIREEYVLMGGQRVVTRFEVFSVKGRGRWVFCKYCFSNVRPGVTFEEVNGTKYSQLVCTRCSAGLGESTEIGGAA